MNLAEMTFQQLLGAVAVILLLLGVYKTIMDAIKIHREEKARNSAPVDKLTERVNAHDEMLARDKRRLDEQDERLNDMRKESMMTLRGVRALLSHEINGNSVEKLQASSNEIDDYLMQRK